MSTAASPGSTELFERERPRLTGLAYRMLGTVSDAEDAVQDAWFRWQRVRPADVDRPEAWLTTVTTRIALDHIRADRRRRECYVGPWLPEPLVSENGPDEVAVLADSLRLGFLALLDRLKPVERAVFLLADVFQVPFAEIADAVGKSEAACRQIASRARQRVRQQPGEQRDRATDRAIVDALTAAIAVGDIELVMSHLAPDVVCLSDGGAAKRAARRPVLGAPRVARLMVNLAHRYAGEMSVRPVVVNGDEGIVVSLGGAIDEVIAFEVRGGQVATIRIVRNPDKLSRVGCPVGLQ
jgi:RNA polymerase sigma-70 factor (ECF subfamily)